ncbi:MAG: ATP-binding cassette domain-containing protein [Proteobacteria bacterium]|nr:ATP-binding cassette domain-containing protein [Pseudomonadota bacterium]NIS71923.1 ATP-binding cassette domain-containing protein [Pseudomonadota bacterium]
MKRNFVEDVVLDVKNLRTFFYTYEGVAKAVDGVSYSLGAGEPLGIVGESGCGKSVSALSVLRLIPDPPGRVVDGEVFFKETNLLELSYEEMRQIRGNRISMIFQEPMTSLNPVFTVGDQVGEAFRLHQGLDRKGALEKSIEMLRLVNIPSPEKCVDRHPHELSGGMRQRAMIAMALACNPEILIADEPTTALDVTIQAQIIDLMLQLKEELGMAIVLITHDLGIIAETVKRVIVMYAGKIVEEAPTRTIFKAPLHPYTQGLLRSIPRLGDKVRSGKLRLEEIPGVVPSLYELSEGCKFSTRCRYKTEVCEKEEPELEEIEKGHLCRCWLTPGKS